MSDPSTFTRIEEAQRGENPTVLCRMRSGWVFMGESQFLRGYAILFADPTAASLNALAASARADFLEDMGLLGDAVAAVTGAVRINYSMLGNLLPILHAHVFPRQEEELTACGHLPVWLYSDFEKRGPAFKLQDHASLMGELHCKLKGLGAQLEDRRYPWQDHCESAG